MKKIIHYGPAALVLAGLMVCLLGFQLTLASTPHARAWAWRAMIAAVLLFPAAWWADRGER